MAARRAAGIRERHSKQCVSANGGRCNCTPSYEAFVWLPRERKKHRKVFPTRAAAKAWRDDARVAVRKGTMRASTPLTLDRAARAWLAGAKAGRVRNRSGDRYKPSALRSYEAALNKRVLSALGGCRLSDIRRTDVQDFADKLIGDDCHPSTIRNTLMPLRAIYSHHLARGDVAVNPTSGVKIPAVRSERPKIVSPDQAERLVAAVPAEDRALWATAMYAGLRLGELRALRWKDVDLASGVIRVEQAWDDKEGAIEPKYGSRRRVPIPAVLRDHLTEHRMKRPGDGLVFGRSTELPFTPSWMRARADDAWEDAGMERIGFHACRHTFASLMIAAGVNAKALCSFMGHSSIEITFDRYGHLMPGSEEEAAARLDAFLEESEQARAAAPESASVVEDDDREAIVA